MGVALDASQIDAIRKVGGATSRNLLSSQVRPAFSYDLIDNLS